MPVSLPIQTNEASLRVFHHAPLTPWIALQASLSSPPGFIISEWNSPFHSFPCRLLLLPMPPSLPIDSPLTTLGKFSLTLHPLYCPVVDVEFCFSVLKGWFLRVSLMFMPYTVLEIFLRISFGFCVSPELSPFPLPSLGFSFIPSPRPFLFLILLQLIKAFPYNLPGLIRRRFFFFPFYGFPVLPLYTLFDKDVFRSHLFFILPFPPLI